MNIEKVKKTAWSIIKDVLLALVVVVIVMGALFAYCQVWPPIVVVESGSMMHGVNSEIGIIDTGDMVLVKKAPLKKDIVTFVEGESRNYRTYGEFGDVIIYRPNGNSNLTPIIHRAVLWLEVNTTHVQTFPDGRIDFYNYTYDVPSLGLYDVLYDIGLQNYGYKERDVIISLKGIMYNFWNSNIEPHSGYITMGDNNNPTYDQRQGSYLLVKEDWVVGKAFGELPWFGLIKLRLTGEVMGDVPPNSWQNLSIAILLFLGIPLFIDFGLPLLRKKNENEQDEKTPGSEDENKEKEGEDQDPEGGVDKGEDNDGHEKKEPGSDGGSVGSSTLDIENDSNMSPVSQIKEKETIIIKEIVKIPCSHCGVLVENTKSKCPGCGAPVR